MSSPVFGTRSCSNDESHECMCIAHNNILCADEVDRRHLVLKRNRVVPTEQVLKHHKIGLLFVQLTSDEKLPFLGPLKYIYDQLPSFEIVFVPVFPKQPQYNHVIPSSVRKQNNFYLFTLHLSQFPWPSLPFSDSSKWRKHVVHRYKHMWRGRRNNCELALFDSSCGGRCLTWDGLNLLVKTFGAAFYPFTRVRETELLHKYHSILNTSSIEGLLANSPLISMSAAKLVEGCPISQLQGKVVGLLFCFEDSKIDHNYLLMKKLEDYRLRANGHFEVVFINLDYERAFSCETSFNTFLKIHPWLLAISFRDERIRPLARSLAIAPNQFSNNHLVIVGGRDNDFFIDPYGYSIMEEYGFDAFPFTRNSAIKLEQTRTTRLKLHNIFETTGTDFIVCMGKGNRKKTKHITCLQSMKVIILYLEDISEDLRNVLSGFNKDNDIATKVVLVTDMNEVSFNTLFPFLPKKWLAFPPSCRRSFKCLMYDKLKVHISDKDFFVFDNGGNFSRIGHIHMNYTGELVVDYFDNDSFRQRLTNEKKWDMEVIVKAVFLE